MRGAECQWGVCDDAQMDGVSFDALLTASGAALLAAVDTAYDGGNALAVARRFRRGHDPPQVAAALTQIELRRRAIDKLGADAHVMYFTPQGLEQATPRLVAEHRARRVVGLGRSTLLDLGCGIGSDLIAFARSGLSVTGVDKDPVTAAVAAANLAALGLTGSVEVGSAEQQPRHEYDVVFLDPSRRTSAGRTFDPATYSPPWSFVEEVLSGEAVVKVAPGIAHRLVPAGVEAEWVSLDGRLKEAALWSAGADGGGARATVLRSDGSSHSLTGADADAADPGTAEVRTVGGFVYEPDDAVIRAHLVTSVAGMVDGWLLDPHLAYVSSDRDVATPFARRYAVIETLPFKEKPLRAALRTRDVGPLTIKKRGIQITPETLRSRLALTGSTPATVIVTRTPGSAVVLLVEPLA